MVQAIETLTFDFLDDISIALGQQGFNPANLPVTQADTLGPLLELEHSGIQNSVGRLSCINAGVYEPLVRAKNSSENLFLEMETSLGLLFVREFNLESPELTNLEMKAKRAGIFAGFNQSDSAKFVAAIIELYNNVIEHSENSDSGYISYAARLGVFEFVVADYGIGVLKSLKTNPNFSGLSDSGRALELVLEDGVSRFEESANRGHGFRPILHGLANISKHIRFRSSDHGREFYRKADGAISAVTLQKPPLEGMFCSVTCLTPKCSVSAF